MSEPKGFPIHRLIQLLQSRIDITNLSLSSNHTRAIDQALLAWIEDVDERLNAFESSMANIGPRIHKETGQDYSDPFE